MGQGVPEGRARTVGPHHRHDGGEGGLRSPDQSTPPQGIAEQTWLREWEYMETGQLLRRLRQEREKLDALIKELEMVVADVTRVQMTIRQIETALSTMVGGRTTP